MKRSGVFFRAKCCLKWIRWYYRNTSQYVVKKDLDATLFPRDYNNHIPLFVIHVIMNTRLLECPLFLYRPPTRKRWGVPGHYPMHSQVQWKSIPFFVIRIFLECLGIPSAWAAPFPHKPMVMRLGTAMPYFGISGAQNLRFPYLWR